MNMKWNYEECKNVVNKLTYLADGCSLIEINFDKDSNPIIKPVDGAAYFVGVPDEEELLKEVREKYPHGFHSRIDVGFEWLKDRVGELAEKSGVQINSIEEYGCIMIDGTNYDAYKIEVEHEHIKSPIFVAMTFVRKKFLVFRPYILIDEFGEEENIGAFRTETEPAYIEPGKIAYFNEIVSVKSYTYDYDTNKLRSESYSFKNNEYGFVYNTRFGKFIVGGGKSYLK